MTSTAMLQRIKAALPAGWFPDQTPVLDAVLHGPAMVTAHGFNLIEYAKLQGRIATATDVWLDILSSDFLGMTLPRRVNESDSNFRKRIAAQILQPKGTRLALIEAVTDLVGAAPNVVEPQPAVTLGGYNTPTWGYNEANNLASLSLPFQLFVTIQRPSSAGVANLAGYGSGIGGYNVGGAIEYISQQQAAGLISDADIYACVASVLPVCTIAWTQIV